MALSVTLDNIDRSGPDVSPHLYVLDNPRPQISLRLGGRSVFTVSLVSDDASESVEEGQELGAFIDGVRVYGGHAYNVRRSWQDNSLGIQYDCDCISWEAKLDRRIVTPHVFKAQTAGAIVTALLAEYGPVPNVSPIIEDGVTIEKLVIDYQPLNEVIDDLAQRSDFVWYCSPDGDFRFHSRTTTPAPYEVTTAAPHCQQITIEVDGKKITRQFIRVNWAAFVPERETFDGDGSTREWNVSKRIGRLDAIRVTTNVQSSSALTFSGAPADGETVTVDGQVYTYKDTIDNSTPREIERSDALSASEALDRLEAAINDSGTGKGTEYSSATTLHPSCTAAHTGGDPTLTVAYKTSGTIGDGVAVSTTVTGASWSSGTLSGGGNGAVTVKDFGLVGDVDRAFYWSLGETTITQDAAEATLSAGPPAEKIEIEYRALGSDVMEAVDWAAIGDHGAWDDIIDDSGQVDAVGELQKAQARLDALKEPSTKAEIVSRDPGWRPGQVITINLAKPPCVATPLITNVDILPDDIGAIYTITSSTGDLADWLHRWQTYTNGGGGGGSSIIQNGGGGGTGGHPDWDKATFGIGVGAAQEIGTQLTPLYVVRLAGALYEITCECGRPGTGSVFLDILRSRDWGATWTSVLTSSSPSPLTLAAGDTVPHVRLIEFNASANEVQIDDLLRIDLLAGSSEDWQDIETVVKWRP